MNELRAIDFSGHTPDVDLADYQPDTLEYWKRRSRQNEDMVRAMKRQERAASPERLLEILDEAQERAYQLAESLGISRDELLERAQEMSKT